MQDHLYERSGQISRRLFTVAVAGSPALFGQQRQPGNPLTVQNLGPQYGKRPPIDENAPFGEPLTFTRDEITCQANPFPLSQVRLLAGPFRQAADANYGYMERLAVDRLSRNFRLNAGLPSPATPLGGWESPKSELRGHFTGHYLSACALAFASAGDPEAKARGDEMVADLAMKTGGPIRFEAWHGDYGVSGDTDLLVNATSIGLYPDTEAMPPVDLSGARPGMLVSDAVFNPPETRLLAAARQRGLPVLDGLSMLVYQGAIGFRLWTGQDAPVAVMKQALRAALGLA